MRETTFMHLLFIAVLFQNCCPILIDCDNDDNIIIEQSAYRPILLDRTSFENSVLLKDPVSIAKSGKIYVKGDLLFINEIHKGFHIYDNSDPKTPKAIQFLEVPGSTDLAIREDIIYINQATDLIAVQYDEMTNQINLTKRVVKVFPELRSPDGFYASNIPQNSIVVDWTAN